MKKATILFALLIGALAGRGQDILYHENFDSPSGGDSVFSYSSSGLHNWIDTNNLWVSSTNSHFAQIENNDTIRVQTDYFSTIGSRIVKLTFDQICKIHFGHRGIVEVTVDSGNTWQRLTGTEYRANSPQFGQLDYFNELSYPNAQGSTFWSGPTITQAAAVTPTNTPASIKISAINS